MKYGKWGVKVPAPSGKGIYWFSTKHSAVEFSVRYAESAPKGYPAPLLFPKNLWPVVKGLP